MTQMLLILRSACRPFITHFSFLNILYSASNNNLTVLCDNLSACNGRYLSAINEAEPLIMRNNEDCILNIHNQLEYIFHPLHDAVKRTGWCIVYLCHH
jgi:hypothetical protein